MIIVPAIYPEIFEEIVDKLYILSDITKFAQIVFCDGSYGLRVSWSPKGKEILPESFTYECDLILTDWRSYLPKMYKLGIKRVIVHIDEFTEQDYADLFQTVHAYDMILGVTVSNEISIDVLVNALRKIESSEHFGDVSRIFVQVSGMRVLAGNEHAFDERAVARVRILKKLFPTLVVQVSGRINPETVWKIKDAGADRMVVSSYLFGSEDIEEALRLLQEAMEQERLESLHKEEEKKALPKAISPSEIITGEFMEPEERVLRKETKAQRIQREAYEASKEEIIYEFDENDLLKP